MNRGNLRDAIIVLPQWTPGPSNLADNVSLALGISIEIQDPSWLPKGISALGATGLACVFRPLKACSPSLTLHKGAT